MASPVSDWNDFDWFVEACLRKATKANLADLAELISQEAPSYEFRINKSDLKPVCLAKVQKSFIKMRTSNDLNAYSRVRREGERRQITTPRGPVSYMPPPTFGGVAAGGSNPHYANGRTIAQPHQAYQTPNGSWSRPESSTNVYNSSKSTSAFQLQDWKESPMWKPIRALTGMEMLPDIQANENSHTRKERKTHFRLSPDLVEKLNQSKAAPTSTPHYSVRLFATSSDHYRPPGMGYQASAAHITNKSIPIEFPTNPDIMVDEYPIPFKERGLRGKPGSAPPFDLDKSAKGIDRRPGSMPSVTMGHTGPTTGKKKDQAKRFWFQVIFAEMTTKDELLLKIKNKQPTSVEGALEAMRKKVEEEDDIQVGNSNLSLKDSLSYMRINTPIRSIKCSHLQCFDAFWWLESNTQHPQWLCPLCNKELKFDELIIDGYFQSILNSCPDDVDEVVVESGGEWHTENGKFGSRDWLASQGTSSIPPPEPAAPAAPEVKLEINRDETQSPDPKGKRKAIEILSSDDDDDEPPLSRARSSVPAANVNGHTSRPGLVPPPLRTIASSTSRLPTPSTTRPSSSARTPSAQAEEVIDLTGLDSDDEQESPPDPSPPVPPQPPPRGPPLPPSRPIRQESALSDDEDDDEDDPFFHQPDVDSTNRDVNDLYPPRPLPTQIATSSTLSESRNRGVEAGKESTVRQMIDHFAGYQRPVLNDAWRRDGTNPLAGYGSQGQGLPMPSSAVGSGYLDHSASAYFGTGRTYGNASNPWERAGAGYDRSRSYVQDDLGNRGGSYRARYEEEDLEEGELAPTPRVLEPTPAVTRVWVKNIWTPGQPVNAELRHRLSLSKPRTTSGSSTSRTTSPPMISPRIPFIPPFRLPTPADDISIGNETAVPPPNPPGNDSLSTSASRNPEGSPDVSIHPLLSSGLNSGWNDSGRGPQLIRETSNPGVRNFYRYINNSSSSSSLSSAQDNSSLASASPRLDGPSIRSRVSPSMTQNPAFPRPVMYDYRRDQGSNHSLTPLLSPDIDRASRNPSMTPVITVPTLDPIITGRGPADDSDSGGGGNGFPGGVMGNGNGNGS